MLFSIRGLGSNVLEFASKLGLQEALDTPESPPFEEFFEGAASVELLFDPVAESGAGDSCSAVLEAEDAAPFPFP